MSTTRSQHAALVSDWVIATRKKYVRETMTPQVLLVRVSDSMARQKLYRLKSGPQAVGHRDGSSQLRSSKI
eukprot:1603641-Amphidinium_carterae.2